MPKQGYFNWSGSLKLHGVTQKVSGNAFVEGKQVEAKFNVSLVEFGISTKEKKVTYAGVGLDDKIDIVVRFDHAG